MKSGDKILCFIAVLCLIIFAIGISAYNNDETIDLASGRNSDNVTERSVYWHVVFLMDEDLSTRGFRY